ncbi:MAG TPA: hypothetical protein VM074_10455 [Solimonas sp.]|nr:hypothetical protein [Solimonas sp.]
MRKHVPTLLACGVALMLMAAPPTAAAASKNAIAKARADCHSHKMKVHSMEAKSPGDPALPAARLDWEHACLKVEQLRMGEAPEAAPPAEAAEPPAS